MVVTCRASSEHPEMPQVVLLLKMPCDSTFWTGTQVANPLRSSRHEQDPRKRNTPMNRVLRAAPLMLSEQSNILTSTEEPTTSKTDPPRPRPPPHPGKVTPCPMLHLSAIWNHLHIEDSCGFQWRDVDAVTPEFPQNLHNTSPEYFRHPFNCYCSKKAR